MNRSRRRFRAAKVAGLIAVLVMAIPAVGAVPVVSGDLVAYEVNFPGPSKMTSSTGLLFVAGTVDSALPALRLSGARISATQFTDSGYEARTPVVNGPSGPSAFAFNTLRALNQAQPGNVTHADALDAAAAATAVQGGFVLNLFASNAAFETNLAVNDGAMQRISTPKMTTAGIEDGSVAPPPVSDPSSSSQSDFENRYWTRPVIEGSQVLVQADNVAQLRVHGTFTIEVMGVNLHLAGTGGKWELESGTWRDGILPGGPRPVDDRVHAIRQSFLRLNVTDGEFAFSLPAVAKLEAVAGAVDATSGNLVLGRATGSLKQQDGSQVRLTGATYEVDGDFQIAANPSESGIQLSVVGLDSKGAPFRLATAAVLPPPGAMAALWAAIGVLAVGMALTLVWARRHMRPATISEIGELLENGNYKLAAREANRFLRRHPDSEDALISRAVALTRSGQSSVVVREVKARLGRRDATDGVLHYVLGLAYLELGRRSDGAEALQEAVRRTPNLAVDVAGRLGHTVALPGPKGVTPQSQQGSIDPSQSKDPALADGYA